MNPVTKPAGVSGVFVNTLGALDHGQSLIDLDDALRDLVRQVQEKGTKGKLTYTVEVIPNGIGVGDVPLLRVLDDLKVSPPKTKRAGETFFVDDHHNLTRRHPGQQDMKLELVKGDKPAAAPADTTKAANN